jgi:nucleoside-diphosphate-sugar epimerase
MNDQKCALVLGAGGFIGHHLVKRLKDEGFWVRGVDRVYPSFEKTHADEFVIGDLCEPAFAEQAINQPFDELYQLAAEMGGAGFIFTGEHDFDIFFNSARINMNVVTALTKQPAKRAFFSSSACVYNQEFQKSDADFYCREGDAYPAFPDSEYGWEKLFSERLFALLGTRGETQVRLARFHNIFGPLGTWQGGREKAPAAMCRKVAETPHGGTIEVWGDGRQLRSFLFIDDCLDGMTRVMRSDCSLPLNVGSDVFVSIRELAEMAIRISGKNIAIRYVDGPIGVDARCSENSIVTEKTGWAPVISLEQGLSQTYAWIGAQVEKSRSGLA